MDLTRLYNLTTPELRAEAERLGVSDTYAMSRGQLIHAIRDRAGEAKPEGLLGKVFGFAKWAMQAAGETATGRPAPTPTVGTAPSLGASPSLGTDPGPGAGVRGPEPEPEPEADTPKREPGTETPSPDYATRTTDSEAGAGTGAGASPGSETETETGAETETEAEPLSESGPPSRPPAGVFSSSVGLFEEPFPTRTMARILADQGHYKRSLAIYARLLDAQPADGDLVAEINAVRARARSRRSHAPQ